MILGVNTLGLGPDRDGDEVVYFRRTLAWIQRVQPKVGILLLTTPATHDWFPGWERLRFDRLESRSWLKRRSDARAQAEQMAGRAKIDLLLTPLATAPLRAVVPAVVVAVEPGNLAGADLKAAQAAAQAAAMVVAPSDWSRDRAMKDLGVPLDRIVVARPGTDRGLETKHPPWVARPYLVAAGGTSARRNTPLLLDTVQRLPDSRPHSLVLEGAAGDAEPAPGRPRVIRIEHCPVAQLAALYQHADAAIIPAPQDGSGTLLLEAMRAGARVIASRAGAAQEVGGHAPVYYDAGSSRALLGAIERVVTEDPRMRARAISEGQHRASEFSWEACAWKWLEAMRKAERTRRGR
jgi:glycosyltransferase involved in cell wall biosynthesis